MLEEGTVADDRIPIHDSVVRHRVALLVNVRLYREGLARALDGLPELQVVGSAPVTEASLGVLTAAGPDIVLLEANAARVPAVVQSILAAVPHTKVVAFAIAEEEHEVVRCAEAGIAGYVSCEASIEDLATTIVRVARGEFPCSPRIAALLASRISSLAARHAPRELALTLTAREREILRLIDEGLSNKEIALRLRIGLSTVKNHVHHILEKTSASRRAQAAARFRRPWTALPEGMDRTPSA